MGEASPRDEATVIHRHASPSLAEVSYPHAGYAWYVVGVLTLAYIFSFIDRQILSLMVGPIQHDLRISEKQMSLLMGASFAVFYTFFGIPLGRLADTRSRRGLIAVGITVWSLMTAGCGLATTFWQLAFCRMGVGVGEASPFALGLLAHLGLLPARTALNRHQRLLDGDLHRCGAGIHPGRFRHAARGGPAESPVTRRSVPCVRGNSCSSSWACRGFSWHSCCSRFASRSGRARHERLTVWRPCHTCPCARSGAYVERQPGDLRIPQPRRRPGRSLWVRGDFVGSDCIHPPTWLDTGSDGPDIRIDRGGVRYSWHRVGREARRLAAPLRICRRGSSSRSIGSGRGAAVRRAVSSGSVANLGCHDPSACCVFHEHRRSASPRPRSSI